MAHEDESYEEWGASASVRIDPGESGRGLSLSVMPVWGNAGSERHRCRPPSRTDILGAVVSRRAQGLTAS